MIRTILLAALIFTSCGLEYEGKYLITVFGPDWIETSGTAYYDIGDGWVECGVVCELMEFDVVADEIQLKLKIRALGRDHTIEGLSCSVAELYDNLSYAVDPPQAVCTINYDWDTIDARWEAYTRIM